MQLLELNGAGFTNKGAQLMLDTAREKLGGDGVAFAMPLQGSNFIERNRRNLRLLVEPSRAWIGPRSVKAAMLRPLRKLLLDARLRKVAGLVFENQIDAVIDISGYAYGDHWGPSAALNLIAHRKALRPGCPVVLLPQMFGPFTRPAVANACRKLITRSDRVFVRDQTSLENVTELVGEAKHVTLAPDITIGYHRPEADSLPPLGERQIACIVPNMRVLDKGGNRWDGAYGQALRTAANAALDAGLQVIVVAHETGDEDVELARSLAAEIDRPGVQTRIIDEPLEFKQLATQARYVVASRFHAAVSALAAGTPTITLGWAHKYGMLLNDFAVGVFDLPADIKQTDLVDRLRALHDDAQWHTLHQTIREAGDQLVARSRTMWDEVHNILRTVSA